MAREMRGEAIWAIGVFVAIVLLAALVNRYRPAHRAQVRRVVILYLLHLAALGIHYALRMTGETVWAARFLVGSNLLQAFTMVNLGATAIFSVLLPATGVVLPMIASDLLVGLGYIGTTRTGDAWFDDVILLELPPEGEAAARTAP